MRPALPGAASRLVPILMLALALSGCAVGDQDANPDAAQPPRPDADPTRPDAGPPLPDADPGRPDGRPLGSACDPFAQDCGSGEKCALIVTDIENQTGFVGCAIDGTAGLDAACTQATEVDTADDCRAGGHCVFGTCHSMCRVGSVACGGGTCVGVSNLQDDFDICLPNCDPLEQNCGDGLGCYLTPDGGVCAAVVGAGGSGVPPGGRCGVPNDCAAGAGCFGSGTCLAYCDFANYPNAPDPFRCGLFEICVQIEGQTEVGACF